MPSEIANVSTFFAESDARFAQHTTERWATLVARVLDASADPRTLAAWASLGLVSTATLRTVCYLAGVTPRRSLMLARLLRAVVIAPAARCRPQDLLDVRDPRTLKQLLQYCPIAPNDLTPMATAIAFVRGQTILNFGRQLLVLESILQSRLAGRLYPGEPGRPGRLS